VFCRLLSGVFSLLLVKILFKKTTSAEFETYNLVLLIFSFQAVLDISYNGIRNFISEANLKQDTNKILSIFFSAFKLNILVGIIMFLTMKLVFLFFGLNGFELIIIFQIIIANLRLITAYYQSVNNHFIASLLDFIQVAVSFCVVYFTDILLTTKYLLFNSYCILAIIFFVFWIFLIKNLKFNLGQIEKINPKVIASKGIQFSLTQLTLLSIPLVLAFYFREINGHYSDFVLANRFYIVILTFQSILITPYWSIIKNNLTANNFHIVRNSINKFFAILILIIFMHIVLFFTNDLIVKYFFNYKLLDGLNNIVFLLNVLMAGIVSLILYFNALDLPMKVQKLLLSTILIVLPMSLILFYFSNEYILASVILFQVIFLLRLILLAVRTAKIVY
jgi:hypothetical protein